MAKKIITTVINTISIIIIILSILVLLTVITTSSGKAPDFFGFSMFKVVSGSMEPAIKADSIIITKKTAAKELSENDIISFYSSDPALEGGVNTHRILEITRDENTGALVFVTGGDANNSVDSYPVAETDIIGRVIFCSYRLGLFINIFSNPIVFIPVIVIPLILLVVINIAGTVKTAGRLAVEEEEQELREAIRALKEEKKNSGK